MFKVKATVIDFLGNKEKYPCHHGYQLGDEFVFDGAGFSGTICPSLALAVLPRMIELHSAGPRYKDYLYYYPFLYSPLSIADPEMKKFDGLGYRNDFKARIEPKYAMANLASSSSFKWPPPADRIAHKDVTMICPDYRTSVKVKIEAFDLSDKGRNIPYLRREMVILDKVLRKPGIKADKILKEFTYEQIEGIYPALSPIMIQCLLEEMEITGYITIEKGKVTATKKAEARLKAFKKSIAKEEIKALGI